ncbi:Pseudouridine synthase family protein [Thalictrum thalictroides]|uniref:Pseudouridine synthase family protein n=1 Tax=Thalictrum thalictroides TaxID=46969 RepID=A0A7J6VTX5_THATH|nr:Pseudouridine synthase family protein [Thalictrum thalictroides]
MATAAAIAALSSTLSSLHLSPSLFFFTKPSSLSSRNFKPFSLIRASSSKTEFNITFGTGTKENLKPNSLSENSENPNSPSIPLLIPWIVRGEDGNLKLQTTPPAHLLHAMANAKTTSTTPKKKKKAISDDKPVLKIEPKFSKAARRFYNENFRDPPQRLSKVLAASGVASRRSSEALIFEGRVTVNGSVCNTPQTRVDPGRDIIYVNGNRISKKLPPKVYIALNKPKGYICSNGEKETKSVMLLLEDYFKSWNKINQGFPKPRLFTVGRLDVATTGLIIITNDGDFAQKISHPSSGLSKEYIAAVDGVVNKRHLIAVSQGTAIEGVHCKPDSVELLPQQPDTPRPRLRIVVHEGRNHEVRELVKNAGLVLYSLKRVRIGGYRLPSDLG